MAAAVERPAALGIRQHPRHRHRHRRYPSAPASPASPASASASASPASASLAAATLSDAQVTFHVHVLVVSPCACSHAHAYVEVYDEVAASCTGVLTAVQAQVEVGGRGDVPMHETCGRVCGDLGSGRAEVEWQRHVHGYMHVVACIWP